MTTTTKSTKSVLLFLGCAAPLPLYVLACTKKAPADPPPPEISSATATVPPVALNGSAPPPVSAFADVPPPDGQTALDQARAYVANGQMWHARLILEKKALGPSGTKSEAELLAIICNDLGDETCLEECGKRLGKRIKVDGGARKAHDAGEHKEPDSDAAKARDLFLKHKNAEARAVLEPKVLDGKASRDEVRLLKQICQAQGDRMCQALCDAKLK